MTCGWCFVGHFRGSLRVEAIDDRRKNGALVVRYTSRSIYAVESGGVVVGINDNNLFGSITPRESPQKVPAVGKQNTR